MDTQGDLMIWGGSEFALDCSGGATADLETGVRCKSDQGATPHGLYQGWVWSLELHRFGPARRQALYQKYKSYGYTHIALQVCERTPGTGYHGLYPMNDTECAGYGAKMNTVLAEVTAAGLIPWCTGLTQTNPPAQGLDRSLCPAVLDDWDDTAQKDCHIKAMQSYFPDAYLWVEMPSGAIAPSPDACSPSPFPASGGAWIQHAQQIAPNFVGVAYEINEPDGHAANLAQLQKLNAYGWRDIQQNRFEIDTYWKFWSAYDFNASRVYNDWFLTNAPWLHGFMSGGTVHPPPSNASSCSASFFWGELDLHTATLEQLSPDFASWPVTCNITSITLAPTGVHVELSNGRPDSWPDTAPRAGMGKLLYTVGLAEQIGGRWYASAPIEYWRGLHENGGDLCSQNVDGSGQGQIAKNWFYDGRWGPMRGVNPKPGDVVGIFVCAGDCRAGNPSYSPVHERSNVALFRLPKDGAGACRISQPNVLM